ncbi:hypothetical protein As57867_006431, partial [Aphanomyces stellatus]
MSAQLMKLHPILSNPIATTGLYSRTTTPSSDPIGCSFSATPNPTLLDKLRRNHKNQTTLYVQIDSGTVSMSNQGSTTTVATASNVHVALSGKKEVQIKVNEAPFVPYAFDCQLSAVEFVGTIHLIQHIETLKSNQ